jgi:hypothetical protein
MLSTIKMRLLVGVVALLLAGVAFAQMPAPKSEANITALTYQSFTYTPGVGGAPGTATYVVRVNVNDTFNTTVTFNPIGPAGAQATLFTGTGGSTCVVPSGAPVVCTMGPNGTASVDLTITTPIPQQCVASLGTIGPVTATQTSNFTPPNQMTLPAATAVGGVPNTVPANAALCPTPIPNTPVPPTPTATPVIPIVVPVIPQVFQQPVGGIFNGPRGNTPTPVRPREVGTAGSTGIGFDQGPVVLRPPSTGDAGLLTLRRLSISAW